MKKKSKGFTLAELLIVIAIIAVLVAIAVPLFTTQLNKAGLAADAANERILMTYVAELVNTGELTIGDTSYTMPGLGEVGMGENDLYLYFFMEDGTLYEYIKPKTDSDPIRPTGAVYKALGTDKSVSGHEKGNYMGVQVTYTGKNVIDKVTHDGRVEVQIIWINPNTWHPLSD